jgi:hypothetical protein
MVVAEEKRKNMLKEKAVELQFKISCLGNYLIRSASFPPGALASRSTRIKLMKFLSFWIQLSICQLIPS